jgi:hypothetical protein
MTSLNSGSSAGRRPSLSPRQEKIAGRLLSQVGPGPAEFFREACELVREQPKRRSVTHLVAHLLREVESAVRSVLEPSDAAAGVRSNRHRVKVLAVLGELGISPQDAVAQWWLQLIGEDNQLNLARRAHRSALDAPRPVDADFEKFIDTVEAVLDVVLERFETHFHQVARRLDVLLAKTSPSNADADSLRNTFPHNQVISHYFFSRASAAWLGPLHHAGFFGTPTPAEVDEDAGTVQIPAWPVSDYLVRVGAEAPAAAVDAALAIPSTDNSRVHHDLVRLALTVPAEQSVRLVQTITEGLGGRFGPLIPHDVGAVAAHLARNGQIEQALELAAALLNRMPADIGPATSVDVYDYAMTLREHIPVLLDAAGAPVFALLASLLDEVIRADAEQRGGPPGRDGSSVWRPTIADDDRRSESELRHALVSAVRDAATVLVESHTVGLAEVVAELGSHEWLIFRRLALDLLSRYPEQACDLVSARLTDPALIRDNGAVREYLLLAQRGATCLDDYHRRRLLTLIDAGPRPTTPSSVSPADEQHGNFEWAPDEIARWQRDRLAAIQQVLPPEWDARYQVLVAEHGPAPDPSVPVATSWVWSRGEDEGPVTAGELSAMSTEALVAFLRNWQPPTDGRPLLSSGTLRGALSAAVQNDAVRRSADAAIFIGLPPVYISAVLNGLWQAVTNNAVLDWDGVVRLSEWINQQAVDELANQEPHDLREWHEPRRDMLRLLMKGFPAQPNPIPSKHGTTVWAIIESSCQDPNPTSGDEPHVHDGFISLADSAVRPQAIDAAIRYVGWQRRMAPDADLGPMLAVLEQHSDHWQDPSLAVRFVYGHKFANLVQLDPDWARGQVDSIFPLDPAQRLLLDAAWHGYLSSGCLTDGTWLLLANVYALMTASLPTIGDDEAATFVIAELGAHLLRGLWHGRIDVDSQDGLIRRFYDHVPPAIATHLMASVGATLADLEDLEPAVVTRLTAFWEFRTGALDASHGDGRSELAEFGRWFSSGHFDPAWSLDQLRAALTRSGNIETTAAVISKVADLAPDHAQSCLTILERWIDSAPHTWRLTHNEDSIRQILTVGLAGNLTDVERSTKMVSVLFRDHGIDLRDLLPGEGHP